MMRPQKIQYIKYEDPNYMYIPTLPTVNLHDTEYHYT